MYIYISIYMMKILDARDKHDRIRKKFRSYFRRKMAIRRFARGCTGLATCRKEMCRDGKSERSEGLMGRERGSAP